MPKTAAAASINSSTEAAVRPAPRTPRHNATVVLDTSVLMADPSAFTTFTATDVVVPLTVIDELDGNKTRSDEPGRNARTALREIEALRLAAGGDISTPVALPGGGTLRIEPNGLRLDELAGLHLNPAVADHRILAAALGLAHGDAAVTVVSNDAALRIKAAVLGLDAAEYAPQRAGIRTPDRTGLVPLTVTAATVELASARRPFTLDELDDTDAAQFAQLVENEFALLTGTAFIVRRSGRRLLPLDRRASAWGLTPRNKEQACALDLALDEDIRLVALRGHAGTGKSILAIAAGLQQVIEESRYDQLMILRPMFSVGRQDLGFLPGDVAEKTAPWFSAVADAMVALSGGKKTFKQAQDELAMHVDMGKVALEPITFLRGRSLNRVYLVCDESQNCEASTLKTVISRLGSGSKLVLTGDDGQIDNSYVSETTCGLNATVDAFGGVDLFGQMFFSKGERSRLADLAAERM